MSNTIKTSMGLGWKSGTSSSNTIYTSMGLGWRSSGSPAPSIGTINVSVICEGVFSGGYTAPLEYTGDLAASIGINASFGGMYLIGGELNSSVGIYSSFSGSYKLSGVINSVIGVNAEFNGNYSEPGVSEGSLSSQVAINTAFECFYTAPILGDLDSEITVEGSFSGEYLLSGNIGSSVNILSNFTGKYIEQKSGDVDMVLQLLGLFGGSYSASLDHILVYPASSKVQVSKTKQFFVFGFDAFDNTLPIEGVTTWSTDAIHGSIDQDGLFTAGDTEEDCSVTATIGSISDFAEVSVLLKVGRNRNNSLHVGISLSL